MNFVIARTISISSYVSIVFSANPFGQVNVIGDKRWNLTFENRGVATHHKHVIDLNLKVLLHDWEKLKQKNKKLEKCA